jgi:uncharacterized membrane protein
MKPWYESKTVWVNVLSLIVLIIMQVMQWPEAADYTRQLAMALSIVNVLLRFITTDGIRG